MSICIVGFSFQSFCVWFIPLSATSWGRKSGHLLIYDCPASINLRDLTSPYFVRAQWDYKSMSTAVLIEDWRPLEAGAVSTSGSFLLLFQRGQWAHDLHIVRLPPTILHIVSSDSQQENWCKFFILGVALW